MNTLLGEKMDINGSSRGSSCVKPKEEQEESLDKAN